MCRTRIRTVLIQRFFIMKMMNHPTTLGTAYVPTYNLPIECPTMKKNGDKLAIQL
jgi:hypothetical protein